MADRKRIGIMGGTFDPIHFGHLVGAEWVREKLNLDEIVFIPTGKPAHKRNWNVTDGMDRLEMVKLAISGNDHFTSSDMEVTRVGITYTIDTINALEDAYGDGTKLYFIIGADSLMDVHSWYRAEDLLRKASFVAVTRPGFEDELILKEKQRLEELWKADIQLIEIPHMGMSSTMIRSRVKQGESARYLVPEPVLDFIREKGLYRNDI